MRQQERCGKNIVAIGQMIAEFYDMRGDKIVWVLVQFAGSQKTRNPMYSVRAKGQNQDAAK